MFCEIGNFENIHFCVFLFKEKYRYRKLFGIKGYFPNILLKVKRNTCIYNVQKQIMKCNFVLELLTIFHV